MTEVCWAPMLAAFSIPLDQSNDEILISQCLEGFRYAIHVTAGMSMKTHRDAFITSLAKFTSLHSAADIKQKNIDAIKVCAVFFFFNIYHLVWQLLLNDGTEFLRGIFMDLIVFCYANTLLCSWVIFFMLFTIKSLQKCLFTCKDPQFFK